MSAQIAYINTPHSASIRRRTQQPDKFSHYSIKAFRRVYTVLAIGAIMEFFGHGMWAVRGKEMMVQLVTNTFDNMLGVSVGTALATNLVRSIGGLDVVISMVMAIALLGFLLGRGILYRLAFSRLLIGMYAWAAFWGFLTAASRITAAGGLFPYVLNLIERGPNFLLPTTLLVLTVYLRRHELTKTVERTKPSNSFPMLVSVHSSAR
ncbi:MAG TPA: hypothetical protein VMM84_13640 [Pyrinomonadaceae bacterium]|nr:hypothetical protein [Pyrinomonadaceae bacterium]